MYPVLHVIFQLICLAEHRVPLNPRSVPLHPGGGVRAGGGPRGEVARHVSPGKGGAG